jgi:hypothetical protein
MAVCLLIAYKFNETPFAALYAKTLNLLFAFFDQEWDLTKKQILEAEFGVYVHLGFSLHISYTHIFCVYSRLLKLVHDTSKHYLGDEMQDTYLQDIFELECNYARDRDAELLQRENENFLRDQKPQQHQHPPKEENTEQLFNNNNSSTTTPEVNNNQINSNVQPSKQPTKSLAKLTEHLKLLPSRFTGSIVSSTQSPLTTPATVALPDMTISNADAYNKS